MSRAGPKLRAGAYDLVALDLDGTLIDTELSATGPVLAALDAAQRSGLNLVVATGRAYSSAISLQRELGIRGPTICQQGAVAYGPDGKVWLSHTLAPGVRDIAAARAADRGDELTFQSADYLYLRAERRDPDFYRRWFGLDRRIVDDWSSVPEQPIKFLLIADDAVEGDALEREWRGAIDGVEVVRSHSLFVEGLPDGVSKGRALAAVARKLGVPRERVLALGDNQNDQAMIEWAGLGVAMGNASDIVRSVADVVAPSIDEDGAAWVLNQLL